MRRAAAKRRTSVAVLFAAALCTLHASAAAADVLALHRGARLRVSRTLRPDASLLCLSAGVHGLRNKTACQRDWNSTDWSNIETYTRARIPVYYRAMLYISTKHRFIYIRQSKSSSTTLRRLLSAQFCKRRQRKTRRCYEADLRYHVASEVDAATWRDFFVFTFVRNPWTRAASAYTFFHDKLMATKLEDGSIGEPCTAVPFLNFTRDPFSMYRACTLRRCCVLRPGRGGDRRWDQENLNPHISDQCHHIFTDSGESTVDFIGRTERLQEDWAALLDILSQRNGVKYKRVQEVEAQNMLHSTLTNATCAAAFYESMYTAETLMNVAKMFAVDVQRLGFIPPALATTQSVAA